MSKAIHFFGNSVFGQLISLIDSKIITDSTKACNSDRYVKKFTTKDHLISMLFCAFAKCTSLREVSVAMLGLAGKTQHFQLNHIPRKSTLGDANQRRDAEVFGKVYQKLLEKYSHVFSDSRVKDVINKQIEIFDSNENAIKIQIYCALIANLLMTVIQKTLKKSWAFSNLVSFCKIHLFNYIHLMLFLENPDKDWCKTKPPNLQYDLF